MGILSRLLGRDKKKGNLPFEYVRDKTGQDVSKYTQIADMVYGHAHSAAHEFAQMLGKRKTPLLVHFFHDFLTVYCIASNLKRLSSDREVASAIVDGVHFEYYRDVNPEVVTSVLQLMAQKPDCFFCTCMAYLGTEGSGATDCFTLALYCVHDKGSFGADELAGRNSFEILAMNTVKNVQKDLESMLES